MIPHTLSVKMVVLFRVGSVDKYEVNDIWISFLHNTFLNDLDLFFSVISTPFQVIRKSSFSSEKVPRQSYQTKNVMLPSFWSRACFTKLD